MRQIKKLLALVLALVMTMGLATVGADAAFNIGGNVTAKEIIVKDGDYRTINGTVTAETITVKGGGTLAFGPDAKATVENLVVEDDAVVAFNNSKTAALTVTKSVEIGKVDDFKGTGSSTVDSFKIADTATTVKVDDSAKSKVETVADKTTDDKIESGSSTDEPTTTEGFKVAVTINGTVPTDVTITANYTDAAGKTATKKLTGSETIEVYKGADGKAGSDVEVIVAATGKGLTNNTLKYQWTLDGEEGTLTTATSTLKETIEETIEADAALTLTFSAKEGVLLNLTGLSNAFKVKVNNNELTNYQVDGNVYVYGGVNTGDTVAITHTGMTAGATLIKNKVAEGLVVGTTLEVVIPEGVTEYTIDFDEDVKKVYAIRKDASATSIVVTDGDDKTVTSLGTSKNGKYELYEAAKTVKIAVTGSGKYGILTPETVSGTISVYYNSANVSTYNTGADTEAITLTSAVAGGGTIVAASGSIVDVPANTKVGTTVLPTGRSIVLAGSTLTAATNTTLGKAIADKTGLYTAATAEELKVAKTDLTFASAYSVTWDDSISEVRYTVASNGKADTASTTLTKGTLVDSTVYLYAVTGDAAGKAAVLNIAGAEGRSSYPSSYVSAFGGTATGAAWSVDATKGVVTKNLNLVAAVGVYVVAGDTTAAAKIATIKVGNDTVEGYTGTVRYVPIAKKSVEVTLNKIGTLTINNSSDLDGEGTTVVKNNGGGLCL